MRTVMISIFQDFSLVEKLPVLQFTEPTDLVLTPFSILSFSVEEPLKLLLKNTPQVKLKNHSQKMLVKPPSPSSTVLDMLMESTQPPRSEVPFKTLCRNTPLFSEDKIFSRRDSKRFMISLKCTKTSNSATEEMSGTQISLKPSSLRTSLFKVK